MSQDQPNVTVTKAQLNIPGFALPSERDTVLTFLMNSCEQKTNIIKGLQAQTEALTDHAKKQESQIAALKADNEKQTQLNAILELRVKETTAQLESLKKDAGIREPAPSVTADASVIPAAPAAA